MASADGSERLIFTGRVAPAWSRWSWVTGTMTEVDAGRGGRPGRMTSNSTATIGSPFIEPDGAATAGDRRRPERGSPRCSNGARAPALRRCQRRPKPIGCRVGSTRSRCAPRVGPPAGRFADSLFLSVRTIDNHLQRAHTKLGVTGRSELAAALDL